MSITTHTLTSRLGMSHGRTQGKSAVRLTATLHKKSTKRRMVRYGIITFNILLLAAVGFFVFMGSHSSTAATSTPLASATSQTVSNPLDQLSSADIAVTVAEMSHIPEATHVRNQADSERAVLAMMGASATLAAKPQVVATDYASNKDIQVYKVKPGDTVSGIARQFHITSDSVRWSNGLTGEAVQAGQTLYIPPLNGIVYTVKAGDTVASLAQKFKARQDQIVWDNDTELNGLHVGERIIIPNGQVVPVAPVYTAYSYDGTDGISSSFSASYGSYGTCYYGSRSYPNYGYDCGYCTWWVAMRRAQSGEPVPSNLGDAYTWKYNAAAAGIPEGTTPRVGAVMWFTDNHVAYVESVGKDGSATISEMNHLGWGLENSRTFSPSEASSHTYIY